MLTFSDCKSGGAIPARSVQHGTVNMFALPSVYSCGIYRAIDPAKVLEYSGVMKTSLLYDWILKFLSVQLVVYTCTCRSIAKSVSPLP